MHGFGPHTRSPSELAASRRLRGTGTPFLELRDDEGRQRLVVLDGERLSIGRADGCGVALPWDPEVSRLHAVVERIDGVWIVEDAGSRNGTVVDDERVSGPRLLQDGAVIRAGRTRILFQCTAPGDASRTEAAVASHEQLKQQRSDDRYRQRVHQRASELYDDVGGWQRS